MALQYLIDNNIDFAENILKAKHIQIYDIWLSVDPAEGLAVVSEKMLKIVGFYSQVTALEVYP